MGKPLQLMPPSEEASEKATKESLVARLFERARRGDIPRTRDLRANEPATLNERHIQAIMMRCMGMKQKDIAATLGFTDSTVSIVLNHPDAQWVIDQIQGLSSTAATDIDARLERLTPRAVDAIEEAFEADESDPKLVDARIKKARLGFSLLEHRGMGKPKEVEHTHKVVVSTGAASLISRALRESDQIEEAEYTIEYPGGGAEGMAHPTALSFEDTEAPPPGGPQGTFGKE